MSIPAYHVRWWAGIRKVDGREDGNCIFEGLTESRACRGKPGDHINQQRWFCWSHVVNHTGRERGTNWVATSWANGNTNRSSGQQWWKEWESLHLLAVSFGGWREGPLCQWEPWAQSTWKLWFVDELLLEQLITAGWEAAKPVYQLTHACMLADKGSTKRWWEQSL